MAIQFNTDLLDRFVAPGISAFNRAEIPDLRQVHDQYPFWLTNHFLESVFSATYPAPKRQYVFNAIYRIQAAFTSYHEARDLTYEYLNITNPDNPAIGSYFHALARWETCFLNWQILIDIFVKMTKEQAFQGNDGSTYQRAYDICNAVKHVGSSIRGGVHGADLTVPLWLSNDGFLSVKFFVSYQEFGNIILEAAQFADELQNPKGSQDTQSKSREQST